MFRIFVLTWFCVGWVYSSLVAGVTVAQDSAAGSATVDFELDVLPIFREHCFRCHGSKNQEAGFRLDWRASAFAEGDSGEPIVAAGNPEDSLLLRRVADPDHGDLMPLDGQPLSSSQIRILSRWIADGADWPDAVAEIKHWAYEPIVRPSVPLVLSGATPVDQFILRRLHRNGLEMSESLDRPLLIRRVSLALTGLPPSPREIDAFVQDDSPDAYEKVVDRLLQSKHFGERWAAPWLDLARYADSNGFQADQIRDNWAYRDWVIRAFNAGLPFNEFVIDQLAGDLRPSATLDQKIATGFHRMTTCNVEAGVHPEANRVNQIVDRVNTTATVFMGTTLECAQCHDHKYDPFTQKDYYQIFAYFNNTPLEVENTSGVTWDFYGPTMDLPLSPDKQSQRERLQDQLQQAQDQKLQAGSATQASFDAWLALLRGSPEDQLGWVPVVPSKFETTGGEDFEIKEDGAVLLSGSLPDSTDYIFTFDRFPDVITAIRIDALTDETIPGGGPGRGDADRTNFILSELTCEHLLGEQTLAVALQNAKADFSQSKWDVSAAIDGDRKTGWAISPQFGKSHWATFVLERPLRLEDLAQLRVTLGQYFGRGRVLGKPRISFYSQDPALLEADAAVLELAKKTEPTPKEVERLRAAFDGLNPELQRLEAKISGLKKQIDALVPDTTLVMVENAEPRETFVMIRGDYESIGDSVSPGVPELFESSVPKTGNRLELARWLTSPGNPILARVTVNRWWGALFGTGLVNTPEDFGTQAEFPSHPDLLNWLASEFIESGWSMKHMLKTMVMSRAFQQQSAASSELYQMDPNNRLLARGPRFRLPAESIRDNALAISGLLSGKMYGPPIMPYQPDNLWRSVGRNQPKWVAAEDEDRFRRGLYIICKRAAPYPSLINFDAPDRGSCTVNRSRTNTPLQALTLLNDPAYAEMSLAFADRILTECGAESEHAKIEFAFRLALARSPRSFEFSMVEQLLQAERGALTEMEVAARTKPPFPTMALQSEDKPELAVWFAVANVLMNLDETLSQ